MSASNFNYIRASDVGDAVAHGARGGSAFLAGGTDLVPLWKIGVTAPDTVVDISRLPFNAINVGAASLDLGAMAQMSDVANHSDVAASHPLIAQAILSSASGQIRNMATIGGNLLQRTRCAYFRTEGLACNKRQAGSGCGARLGDSRQAALYGATADCVATHPSDLAVALTALDARVKIFGAAGERWINLSDLYQPAAQALQIETVLASGELITNIQIANGARFKDRSIYLKVRDRASFEFAVISVAAALRIEDGTVVKARLVAGGVAPYPWRLVQAEENLLGRPASEETYRAAAAVATTGAEPLKDNAFKINLLEKAVARALTSIGGTI